MSPSLRYLQAAPAPSAAPASTAPTVLIADADVARGRELAARCQSFGWVPLLAVDALQAVTFTNRNRPDLVVLHTRLPAGNGLGALERIRRLPGCMGLPVVMIGVPAHDEALVARCRAAARDVVLLADATPDLVAGALCALLPVEADPAGADLPALAGAGALAAVA